MKFIYSYIKVAAVVAILSGGVACGGVGSSAVGQEDEMSDLDSIGDPAVVRLDSLIRPGMDAARAGELFAAHPEARDGIRRFARILGREGTEDSIFASDYASSRAVTFFKPDVDRRIPDLDRFRTNLRRGWARARRLCPGLVLPDTVYTIVSPYRQGVFSVDSATIFVAVNHFLGAEYEGYEGFSAPERASRETGRLAVAAMEGVIRNQIEPPGDVSPTAIAAMAREGAIVWTLAQVFPDVPDYLLLGMPKEDADWLEANSRDAFRALTEAGMLFTTDPSVVRQVAESPLPLRAGSVTLPPLSGRWLGLRLLRAVADGEKGLTPAEALSPQFATDPSLLQRGAAALK
ncbi:MAG: hypothetical protein NC336_10105 [Clostridium sp.]|nr:hypothetical protein [Clostridium sp.]